MRRSSAMERAGRLHGSATWLCLLLIGTPCWGQTLPLGGRTASMGGAAAAAGRDGAMPYVNPAGFALVPSTTLSLSASLYRYERIRVDDFFFQGDVDSRLTELAGDLDSRGADLVSSRFTTFPGAASVLWHFGPDDPDEGYHQVLSANIIVSRNTDSVFGGDFALTFENGITIQSVLSEVVNVTEYNLGPGYALRVGPLRLGVAATFHYLTGANSSVLTGRVLGPDAFTTMKTTVMSDFDSLGFAPVVGTQVTLFDSLSLGASFAPETIHITGSVRGQSEQSVVAPDGVDASDLSASRLEGDYQRNRPMRLRVGAALERPKSWSLAADVGVEFPIQEALKQNVSQITATQVQGFPVDIEKSAEQSSAREVGAVSVYAGGEVFLNEMMALRVGMFAQPSTRVIEESAADVLGLQLDTVGGALGLGIENDLGEVTFGLSATFGKGYSIAQNSFGDASQASFQRVGASAFSLNAFIGGAIDIGEFSPWMVALRDPSNLFNVDKARLTIADLDPQLGVLVPQAGLRRLEGLHTEYVLTGVSDFDAFFARIARIRLALEATPDLITELTLAAKAALNSASARPNGRLLLAQLWLHASRFGTQPLPSQLSSLPQAEHTATTIQLALALRRVALTMIQDFGKLPNDGQRLVEAAQDHFTGSNLILLPAVLKQLGRSQSDLSAAINSLPRLARSIDSAFDAFTGRLSLPAGGLPDQTSSSMVQLSALSPVLNSDEGSATLDVTHGKALERLVTGVPELDALLHQVGLVELANRQMLHVHEVLQRQLEVVAPFWKHSRRTAADVLDELVTLGQSADSRLSEDLRGLESIDEIFRSVKNAQASIEASKRLHTQSAALSESLRVATVALTRVETLTGSRNAAQLRERISAIADGVEAARNALMNNASTVLASLRLE